MAQARMRSPLRSPGSTASGGAQTLYRPRGPPAGPPAVDGPGRRLQRRTSRDAVLAPCVALWISGTRRAGKRPGGGGPGDCRTARARRSNSSSSSSTRDLLPARLPCGGAPGVCRSGTATSTRTRPRRASWSRSAVRTGPGLFSTASALRVGCDHRVPRACFGPGGSARQARRSATALDTDLRAAIDETSPPATSSGPASARCPRAQRSVVGERQDVRASDSNPLPAPRSASSRARASLAQRNGHGGG